MAEGTSTGYSGIMGAAKETTFRTPVSINTRIPVIDENLIDEINRIEDDSLTGKPGRQFLDAGPISVKGSINTQVRYPTANGGRTIFFGNDLLIALAMGSCSWHAGSSTNILKLSDDIDKFATIPIHKKIMIWEFISCFFKGFKLSVKSGEIWKTSLDVVAYNLNRGDPTTGTQQNKQTQFDALNIEDARRVLFGDSTWILAPVNIAWGGTESAYRIGFNDFSLNYDSGLTDSEFTSPDASSGHTNANLTIQPVRGAKRNNEIEFTMLRYHNLTGGAYQWATQLFAWRNAETPLQMLCTIHPSEDSTRIVKVMIPYMIITELDAPAKDSSPIQVKGKAKLLRGGGRNIVLLDAAGSSIAEEFQLEFKNSNNTSAEYGRNAAIF